MTQGVIDVTLASPSSLLTEIGVGVERHVIDPPVELLPGHRYRLMVTDKGVVVQDVTGKP